MSRLVALGRTHPDLNGLLAQGDKGSSFEQYLPTCQHFVHGITDARVTGWNLQLTMFGEECLIALPPLEDRTSFFVLADTLDEVISQPWTRRLKGKSNELSEEQDVMLNRVMGGSTDGLRIVASLASSLAFDRTGLHPPLEPTEFNSGLDELMVPILELSGLHETPNRFLDVLPYSGVSPFDVYRETSSPGDKNITVEVIEPLRTLIEAVATFGNSRPHDPATIQEFVKNIFTLLVLNVYSHAAGLKPDSPEVQRAFRVGIHDWEICADIIPLHEPGREAQLMMALYTAAKRDSLKYGTPEMIGRSLLGGCWGIAGKLKAPLEPLITCPARLGKVLHPWYRLFSGIYSEWYANEMASKELK